MGAQNPRIDLSSEALSEVRLILAREAPGCEVWAFGSRVQGKARPHSDLDLAIVAERPLGLEKLARLREAFAESTLPVRVDVIDWASTPESFRRQISACFEVLVPATQ